MELNFELLLIVFAVTYSLFACLLLFYVLINRHTKEKYNKERYESLQKYILNGTVYDSFGVDMFCKTDKYGDFETFVKRFLKFSLKTLDCDAYNKVDQFMRMIIIEKSKAQPFEGCNIIDKQYILSINEAIDKSNEAALNGIKELARRMVDRDNLIHEQARKQKIVTWITIIGLIINIFFGVLSVIHPSNGKDAYTEQINNK